MSGDNGDPNGGDGGIDLALVHNRREASATAVCFLGPCVGPGLGGSENGVALGLTIRHDHGCQFRSRPSQDELRFLGATASPSFVREPEGNGVIERFWRTLKEQLLWVWTYRNVEDLCLARQNFCDLYNRSWMLQKHGYLTTSQVSSKLAYRQEVAASVAAYSSTQTTSYRWQPCLAAGIRSIERRWSPQRSSTCSAPKLSAAARA